MNCFTKLVLTHIAAGLAVAAVKADQTASLPGSPVHSGYVWPVVLSAIQDGQTLLIGCGTGRILGFDPSSGALSDFITLPGTCGGACISRDSTLLFAICAAEERQICTIDVATRNIIKTIPVGRTAIAPVLSADAKTLYVCNRFDNSIGIIDVPSGKSIRVPVQREPVSADITKDGKFLLVANHLPRGRADVALVAATISIIDLEAAEVVKELQLPNGSGSLNDLRISPDGKYAAVAHTISRFHRPASSVRRGWMNINALSIIDINTMALYNTVILDDLDSGAANPCGVAWTPDGATVLVTHSGTHEVSFIDFHMVLDQLPNLAATPPSKDLAPYETYLQKAEAAESIPFLMASHPRIKLPATDLGPRAVIVAGHSAYVANYFSETLTAIDLASPDHKVESILLTSQPEIGLKRKPRNREDVLAQMRPERRGEFYFHDASICDQGWQSCSSCHPDGRADGLNWDLLNDGFDNPKNTKSLLLAHRTPPCMWLGVRETAESAVRSGIRNILFTKQPEHVAADIDAYLKSLKPIPSPYLVYPHTNDSVRIEASLSLLTDPAGVSADKKKQLTTERPPSKSGLSVPAKRGAIAFTRAGCAGCHPPPLFTNRRQYDVGTRGPFDKPVDKFDTPTLIELWRTAPYLHDGSAITVREIMTTRNPHDAHGTTSILTSEEIDDLCAYVLSL